MSCSANGNTAESGHSESSVSFGAKIAELDHRVAGRSMSMWAKSRRHNRLLHHGVGECAYTYTLGWHAESATAKNDPPLPFLPLFVWLCVFMCVCTCDQTSCVGVRRNHTHTFTQTSNVQQKAPNTAHLAANSILPACDKKTFIVDHQRNSSFKPTESRSGISKLIRRICRFQPKTDRQCLSEKVGNDFIAVRLSLDCGVSIFRI